MSSTTPAAASRRRASIKQVAALCVVLALSGAAACSRGGDSATAPKGDVIGVYRLQSIANTALPVKVFDGSATDATTGNWYAQFIVTIKSGSFELDAQGRYHSSFDYTLVHDGVSEDRTLVADGAYSIDGSDVILRRSDGKDVTEGSIRNGELTVEMTVMGKTEPRPYVFRK
jgi:hypothetical protein